MSKFSKKYQDDLPKQKDICENVSNIYPNILRYFYALVQSNF